MLHVPKGLDAQTSTTPSWGTTRPSSSPGSTVTPGTGGYGSYVQLFSALAEDAHGITIMVTGNGDAAASRTTLMEIGVDNAGGTSYTAVIQGLLVGGAGWYNSVNYGLWYYFPLFIKSGSTVGVAAYSSVASTFKAAGILHNKTVNPSATRVGSYAETIGYTSGTTGKAITPGTTSEGSWTSIGTTAKDLWWWQLGFQVNDADNAWNDVAIHLDLAVGDATNKDIIIKDFPIMLESSEGFVNSPFTGGMERFVPAGSTLYMRAQCSGALDAYTCLIYGIGGGG
jgi:hypothetical protein